MKLFFILIFLLLSFRGYAVKKDVPDALPNEGLERSSYSFFPKVDPISGEYVEEATDLIVAGCCPLSAQRVYRHQVPFAHRPFLWNFNPESLLRANFEKDGISKNVLIGDRGGGALLLTERKESENSFLSDRNAPITNTSFGHPSGQTNPHNFKVTYRKNCDRKEPANFQFLGEVRDGSGRLIEFHTPMHKWHKNVKKKEVTYTPAKWTPYFLHIDREILPNGNILHYQYEPYETTEGESLPYPCHFRLKEITAKNKSGTRTLGSLRFDYPQRRDVVTTKVQMSGSDGRKAECEIAFQKLSHIKLYDPYGRVVKSEQLGCTVLSKSESRFAPMTTYHYDNKLRLEEIHRPDGRVFKTVYNEQSKVQDQFASLGVDGKLEKIAHYDYFPDETHVYDGEGNLTKTCFDKEKRITAVIKCQGTKVMAVERKRWNACHQLIEQSLEDEKGTLLKKTVYHYDEMGNISEELLTGVGDSLDASGHLIPFKLTRTYSKDGFNLKLSEEDGSGRVIRYSYLPGTNLCTQEILYEGDAVCKRTLRKYDDCAICTQILVDDGERPTYRKITNIAPKYSQPCFGLPESIEEKTIDRSGKEILLSRVVYTYSPSGKIEQEDHYNAQNALAYSIRNKYNLRELLVKTVDAMGHETAYTYDANCNILTQKGPHPDLSKEFVYDQANRLIVIREKTSEGKSIETKRDCDRCGRVRCETDPCGHKRYFEYNYNGQVTKVIHPDGVTEIKEYDALGNVTKEIDGAGYVKETSYTHRGHPVKILHPDGSIESFTYFCDGKLKRHVDRNGCERLYTYDAFDHPIETAFYDAKGNCLKKECATFTPFTQLTATDGEGHVTSFTYDFAGRKCGEELEGRKIEFFYDALGHLHKTKQGETIYIEEIDSLNRLSEKRVETVSGKVLRQVRYTYDAAGHREQVIDSKGGVEETKYNAQGLPILKKDPMGFVTRMEYIYGKDFEMRVTNPKGVVFQHVYDGSGREKERVIKNQKGEVIHKTSLAFDGRGHVKEERSQVYEGNKRVREHVINWRYGPSDRLEVIVEGGIRTTKHFYDKKGRLEKVVKPSGIEIHYAYDALGRLARQWSADFDDEYQYDRNDHVVKAGKTTREYDAFGNIKWERLANGLILQNAYDAMGRRKQLTLPDGSVVHYSYQEDMLHTISYKEGTHTYVRRDLEGKLVEANLPFNLGKMEIHRDSLSRPHLYSTPFYSANHDYDETGNLRRKETTVANKKTVTTYTYDPFDQLLSENELTYTYDSLHNRLKKSDLQNIITALNQVEKNGQMTFTYDVDGNLKTVDDRTYEYDTQDRLTRVGDVEYQYDAFHRRIGKIAGKTTTLYIWDDQNEIGSTDAFGNVLEVRILGEGLGAEIGSAVLIRLDQTLYVPLHDIQGSLIALIDPSGAARNFAYSAFGEGSTTLPWGFCSKRTDPETGLIYFGRRYYDPILGRFITPDPEGFDDGPNLYAYVHNNPLTHTDPYGLFTLPDWSFNLVPNTLAFGRLHGFTSFEDHHTGRSYNYNLLDKGYSDLPEGGCITWINGMNVLSREGELGTLKLGTLFNSNIYSTIYPTGGILRDFVGYCANTIGIKTAAPGLLMKNWDNHFDKYPNKPLLHFCHSYGATMTNLALLSYPEARRKLIMVAAFAPGSYINPDLCMKVTHYVSRNDPIPRLPAVGRLKYQNTIVNLPPHPTSCWFDHSFNSRTYEDAKIREMRKYQNILYADFR